MSDKMNERAADMALLPEPIYTFAQIVGFDKALEIAKTFSGESLYMPKYENVVKQFELRKILGDFNGYNYKYLAKKYNLGVRHIRRICGDFAEEKKSIPPEGQINLFDE